jgi:hypothetical protein
MNKLKAAGAWALARAGEASTWAGIGVLLALAHVPHANELNPLIVQLGGAVAGIIAILRPEAK